MYARIWPVLCVLWLSCSHDGAGVGDRVGAPGGRVVEPVEPVEPAVDAPVVHAANAANAAPRADTAGSVSSVPADVAARLLTIAGEYRSYGRVDDIMHWAPTDCRAPGLPSLQMSQSGHKGSHGRKLYSLLARDPSAYMRLGTAPSPAGQILVKESWRAESAAREQRAAQLPERGGGAHQAAQVRPYAYDGGQLYRAVAPGPLFIMYQAGDAGDQRTDQGWLYGTVTADGQRVTAGGLIRSCMGCHAKAPHGRLFGPGYRAPAPTP